MEINTYEPKTTKNAIYDSRYGLWLLTTAYWTGTTSYLSSMIEFVIYHNGQRIRRITATAVGSQGYASDSITLLCGNRALTDALNFFFPPNPDPAFRLYDLFNTSNNYEVFVPTGIPGPLILRCLAGGPIQSGGLNIWGILDPNQ